LAALSNYTLTLMVSCEDDLEQEVENYPVFHLLYQSNCSGNGVQC